MTQHSPRLNVRWPVAIALAIGLLTLGAAVAYLFARSDGAAPAATAASSGAANKVVPPAEGGTRPMTDMPADVTVTLSADAVSRAGITVSPAQSRTGASVLRLPATIEPNAYRQVDVTPIAAGRVTSVTAELGEHVNQGHTLAQIFSPELAEAQTQYVTARAALDAHEKEVVRTEKLTEIGAASRQELERVRAEHTEHASRVESIAARLELLGRSRSSLAALDPHATVDAVLTVPAPLAGVVTQRDANVGLNVDSSTKLFTIVDLSTVWAVAKVFENDFAQVRVGEEAVVTTKAYPDRRLSGRITYIDPQLDPQTRTAAIRVEIPNGKQDLRLGMLAEVQISHSGRESTAWIPTSAIQRRGDRVVVYLATASTPGRFMERQIQTGSTDGNLTEVIAGLQPGDPVVTDGSFFLRAEVERQGSTAGHAMPISMPKGGAQAAPAVQSAKIVVNEKGFEPAEVTFHAKAPARLTFVRTAENTCATEVLIESLNIKRELPLNKPVDIEFTPDAGRIAFACGMKMFRGAIVVR
jgi:RND family efflux transporter MFP subunit